MRGYCLLHNCELKPWQLYKKCGADKPHNPMAREKTNQKNRKFRCNHLILLSENNKE